MQTLAQLIKTIAEDGSEDTGFRNDYSGRGMYGHTCVGITGSEDDCQAIVAEVIKELHTSAVDDYCFSDAVDILLGGMKTDSMGRSNVIYYWPELDSIPEAC